MSLEMLPYGFLHPLGILNAWPQAQTVEVQYRMGKARCTWKIRLSRNDSLTLPSTISLIFFPDKISWLCDSIENRSEIQIHKRSGLNRSSTLVSKWVIPIDYLIRQSFSSYT